MSEETEIKVKDRVWVRHWRRPFSSLAEERVGTVWFIAPPFCKVSVQFSREWRPYLRTYRLDHVRKVEPSENQKQEGG